MKTEQLNQLVTNSPGSFPYQGLNEMTFLNNNVIILLFFGIVIIRVLTDMPSEWMSFTNVINLISTLT